MDVILLVSTFDKKGKELKAGGEDDSRKRSKNSRTERETGSRSRYFLQDRPRAKGRTRPFVVRVIATNRTGTADADLLAQAALPAKAP